jgi:DNA processing protein
MWSFKHRPDIIRRVDTADTQRLLNWLRLTRLRGVGPVLIKRLLGALGSPEAILGAHPANLAAVDGIGTIKANQIVTSAPGTLEEAKRELEQVVKEGFTLLPLDDAHYPPGLKTMADPPLVLYVRGAIVPQDAVAVGMVGARRCTLYGREQAQKLACGLAERGLAIVSGGARGIDTCAHLGALQGGGRTLVVTGCGLLNTYPPENAGLYDRIVKEDRGAVISELPLAAPPNAENFPPRNRIIAGLSLGIVVVEANLQSGSLITARLAAADYGREVFALPGRVDSPASAGTHYLIKSAMAHLVESAQDVLDHLGDVGRLLTQAQEARDTAPETPTAKVPAQETLFSEAPKPVPPAKPPLTSVQEKIMTAIGAGASLDEIVETAGVPTQVVMAELTLLAIQGRVKRLGGNRFGPV